MPDTQSLGSRAFPPGWSVTRDASETPEGGSILIGLGREDEATAVAASFEGLGWRVAFVGPSLPQGPFDQVYLDGFGALRLSTLLLGRASWLDFGREARTVALVDAGEEAERPAWTTGVEWVVSRPLSPHDPLGVGSFLDPARWGRSKA